MWGQHITLPETSLQQKSGPQSLFPTLFPAQAVIHTSQLPTLTHTRFLQPALRKDPDSALWAPTPLSPQRFLQAVYPSTPLNSLSPTIRRCPFQPTLKAFQYAANFRHLRRMAGTLAEEPSKTKNQRVSRGG